jgi:transposase
MTYIVKQKIRGKIYVYEAEGYWDPQKKQARQRRRYLGVWDEESGTIKPREAERTVRITKEYGAGYLLKWISEELKLGRKLEQSFGDDGKAILALAIAKVLRPVALKNISHIMEDSMVSELCRADTDFSSQWISDLLTRISKDELGNRKFCSSLIEKDEDALIYDITSLSSVSKNINWLEYGDDYRKLDTPQVNLGIVYSIDRKIPIYHKVFPGSINDVSTLKNLLSEVKILGIKKGIYILDRGFFSESNIIEMLNEGVDFIIPLPFSTKIGMDYLSDTNLNIESPENARRFNKKIYYVIKKDVNIGCKKLNAYVLFNTERKADEVNSFYNRLIDIENILEGKMFYGDPIRQFEKIAGTFKNYFDCSVENRRVHLKRRPEAIAQAVNRMGKMILLSSLDMPWDEVLSLYRERDAIEKLYNELKNDLDIIPLRVRNNETLKGLTLVYFVAMIIRSILLQKARKAKLLEKDSIESLLMEMGKLRAVQIGNTWKLTEISKRQRIIMEKLGIPVPVSP